MLRTISKHLQTSNCLKKYLLCSNTHLLYFTYKSYHHQLKYTQYVFILIKKPQIPDFRYASQIHQIYNVNVNQIDGEK